MGSRDDKDHRSHCGGEVGSHQSGDELLEENGHNGHAHHHSSHVGVGFCRDNHHGEENIHGMVHGGRSHQGKVGEQGNGSELGREGYPVGSITVSKCREVGKDGTNISDAGDSDALEFAAIQFLYCGFEVRSSFELDEASG